MFRSKNSGQAALAEFGQFVACRIGTMVMDQVIIWLGVSVLAPHVACLLYTSDTGAMYRSIGLYAVRQGKDPHDAAAVEALLPQIHLDTKLEEGTQHFYLNGEDVSSAIRAEEIGMAASAVAAIPAVRTFLLDAQRTLAASRDVLMDGRDIGTVVLPNATVKIFLTATPEARAERRYKELLMKGEKHDYQNVLADVRARDYQDTHRAAAPLRQAEDAVLVDTSELNFDQSFEALKKVIQDRAK